MSTDYKSVTAQSLSEWALPRGEGSKYERGQVLVIGGAPSSPGAALLAGTASLRVGGGRLTLAVAESVALHVAVALPECAALPLSETHDRHIDGSAVGQHPEFDRADAVLIGPGLDDADEAVELLDSVVPQLRGDAIVVLDAFALSVLPRARTAEALSGRLILTPNHEEAEFLLGRESDSELADLTVIAKKYGAVVTCFGAIASPEQAWRVDLAATGLGTSGSGDVLAGAIAGLAARGAPVDQATVWGTYLHVRAGQLAGRPPGQTGYLASEIAAALPLAVPAHDVAYPGRLAASSTPGVG
jgi:hydroxyethylthiazole kinase-like uncharacterized protein yjeF